jgi:hypothetical protein
MRMQFQVPGQVSNQRSGRRRLLPIQGTPQPDGAGSAVDPYQVSTDKRCGITSDPNRDDDPEYIVRLIGQVTRVSVESMKIVKGLPPDFEPATP